MVLRIAILGSTNGTSSQLLLNQYSSGNIDNIEIPLILSNRKNAGILEKAKIHNINAVYLPSKNKIREEYDREVDTLLTENNIELLLLIGYMKFMSPWFVDKWLNKVMNIHPSLLPAFAGGMDINVHQAVLDRGCKVTGASLMFIDHGADTGPIISQRVVPVEDGDTQNTLKQKVQAKEKEMILEAVLLWRDGRISVENTHVKID